MLIYNNVAVFMNSTVLEYYYCNNMVYRICTINDNITQNFKNIFKHNYLLSISFLYIKFKYQLSMLFQSSESKL